MDFEEFREKLMEDLAQDLYENTGAEYSIEATSINKLQNAGYEGEFRNVYIRGPG